MLIVISKKEWTHQCHLFQDWHLTAKKEKFMFYTAEKFFMVNRPMDFLFLGPAK